LKPFRFFAESHGAQSSSTRKRLADERADRSRRNRLFSGELLFSYDEGSQPTGVISSLCRVVARFGLYRSSILPYSNRLDIRVCTEDLLRIAGPSFSLKSFPHRHLSLRLCAISDSITALRLKRNKQDDAPPAKSRRNRPNRGHGHGSVYESPPVLRVYQASRDY